MDHTGYNYYYYYYFFFLIKPQIYTAFQFSNFHLPSCHELVSPITSVCKLHLGQVYKIARGEYCSVFNTNVQWLDIEIISHFLVYL